VEYTHLGRTGLQVSRLCLGTMNRGPQTSETDSFAIMDKALELGINFFDTANRYGGHLGVGITEQIIGRWLAQGGRRDQIVLATKVYGPMGDGPNDRGLSAYHLRRACDDGDAADLRAVPVHPEVHDVRRDRQRREGRVAEVDRIQELE
jgi:NDP-hexose C3-ketoreductase / dTDP-4-oxo-2-deoxy-alpha-D-pentos-2-ene 2,3-reductase